VLRSIANPPMDENNPETVFSLVNYLNREQYGSRPLVKGQYYNAPVVDSKEPYTYRKKNGEYIKQFSLNPIYKYDKRFTTVLPRMYSPNPEHIKEYKKWGSIKGRKITITGQDGKPQIKYIPTFGENIKFFFRYQVNHMYLRYFWWNFAGKQNDIQGHGGSLHGNWLSGFDFYDNMRLGPQENQPEQYKNHKARNIYYMLPFLLGLIGFFFQYNKNKKDFWVVTMLFVLTGLAIVVYLNQTPMQPRERDYAYAGSFYAFAIWIGLGVMGIANLLSKKLPKVAAASLSTIVCLVFVPGIMASENWDDHDRSDRYTARDYAYNYLNSCAPNAILFTHGDNDTFPLWYAQEVEGIRTDVRVVNLSLLNTGWYIDQMKRKAYDSEPVPFSMEHEQYLQGKRDQVYIFDRIEDYVNLRKIIDFVADDDDRTKIKISTSEMINYIPTKKFILSVDSTTVVNNGTVKLKNADKIVPEIKWEINKRRVLKSELMILDLLATNNWERPVYFVSAGGDSNMGLDNYLQLEGFAYRLVPIKTESNDYLNIGGIDADIMYNNLMNKFQWGNMNDTNIYVDHTLSRTTSVIRIRNKFSRLANKLLENGEKDKAVAVLDKCVELMPNKNFPYDLFVLNIIESYYKAGANDKANKIVKKFASISEHDMNYYFALEEPFASSLDYEKRVSAHIMQRLIDVTQRYKQAELSKEIEQSFNNAIRFM
jgi:tetratricopeptide (TPR) repeat protein